MRRIFARFFLVVAVVLVHAALAVNLSDPAHDESGTYPTSLDNCAPKGTFDLLTFALTPSTLQLTFSSAHGNCTGNGFDAAVRVTHVYISSTPGGSWRVQKTGNASLAGGEGMALDNRWLWNWHIAVEEGRSAMIEDAQRNVLAVVPITGATTTSVSVDLPGTIFNGNVGDDWHYLVAVGAHLGVSSTMVEFRKTADATHFGGGEDPDASGVRFDPNVVDILNLATVDQERILGAYCVATGSQATATPIGSDSAQAMRPSPPFGREPGGSMCVTSRAWSQFSDAAAGYVVDSVQETDNATFIILTYKGATGLDSLGADIATLICEIGWVDDSSTVRLRFIDASAQRWEVPTAQLYGKLQALQYTGTRSTSQMTVQYPSTKGALFSIVVIRNSDKAVLFNSTATETFRGLVFKDSYLELSTALGPEVDIYGFGERVTTFRLPRDNMLFTFSDMDDGTPLNQNLYGSHPIFVGMHPSGAASGVFLLTSNSLDVALKPQSITYRVTGGVLDFFVFAGPSAHAVVKQYHALIGLPALPPYWSLGFHQCRWGYPNVSALEDVVANYNSHNLPLDTMWTDIDYMDKYKLFTLDPVNFPAKLLRPFVDNLHANNQQYVVIIDPGVFIEEGYGPYDQGMQDQLFIRQPLQNNNPVVGKVWPGQVHFVDWAHPNTSDYWGRNLGTFWNEIPIDGLWTDMNEVANFCDGPCVMDPNNPNEWLLTNQFTCSCNTSVYSPLDYNVYWPGFANMPSTTTMSFAAEHYGGATEHNMHNLYGHMEAQYSYHAMMAARDQKRPLVITRSTFPGTGAIVGHWLGDNYSTWQSMRYSIPGVLAMQVFGIPLVGADICGFMEDTTPELCARWMQLGSFYPFSRNHNNKGQISQEPYALGPEVLRASEWALYTRYRLIPYLYSHFVDTHFQGGMVVFPLGFEFPTDSYARTIDKQFLFGRSILVNPVVDEGAQNVTAYFPGATWYALFGTGGAKNKIISGPANVTLPYAYPGGNIPLYLRGGSIVPIVKGSPNRSVFTRNAVMDLIVGMSSAISGTGAARGFLHVDLDEHLMPDSYTGVSVELTTSETMTTKGGFISAHRVHGEPQDNLNGTWADIVVFGVNRKDFCDKQISFTLQRSDKSLRHNSTLDRPTLVCDDDTLEGLNWLHLQVNGTGLLLTDQWFVTWGNQAPKENFNLILGIAVAVVVASVALTGAIFAVKGMTRRKQQNANANSGSSDYTQIPE